MTHFKKDTRTAEEQSRVTEEERKFLRLEMAIEARETLGAGYTPDYYMNIGQGYAVSAERFTEARAEKFITEQVTPRDEFITELAEALKRFGVHSRECNLYPDRDFWIGFPPYKCSCGYDRLLTKARDRGYDHEQADGTP